MFSAKVKRSQKRENELRAIASACIFMHPSSLLLFMNIFFTKLLAALFTGILCIAGQFSSYAQQVSVTFKTENEKKQPVPFASIVLTDRADSTLIKQQITDSAGIAVIQLNKGSQYNISISSINYQPIERGILITEQSNFIFTLAALPKTLTGVIVRSSKPLMREEDDKTIVDPENLIPSSTSSYEVLEKTPGLFIDQDGNIYISSTTPATILINGRELKMSTADIATMLKSLPPGSISKIEIVRTPSAKYDASGSGGIVNVVLKKGVNPGITGSATAGWQQGKYANEIIGFNLNNNNGKISSFINLSYSKRNNYERIKTDRLFAADSTLSQDAYTTYPSDAYYIGYGLGYEKGKKWSVSYDGRISLNTFDNRTDNGSIIQKISNQQVITDNLAKVNNEGSAFSINQGVAAKYKIDSLGSEWTSDLSYTYARNNTDQLYSTDFTTPVYPTIKGNGNSLNKRNFLAVQTDISWKLPKRITLESGIKTTLLYYNSATDYYKQTGNTPVKDEDRTNTFRYNENINAAYLQASKTFLKDIILKIGSRVENTNMKGRQIVPGDTSFTIRRTDFFPYVYLSKKIITIVGFDLRAYLVYRRTINRPVYEQLNPFARYVDQYLSEAGNPGLRPQFTQNFEANVSVNETPLLAIGINDTKDIFTNVIYQADSSQSQAYQTYDNLGKNKEFYIRGLGAIPPGKRYFFVVGGQYNHNLYQGIYENKPLHFKKGSWTFFTYHTYRIDKRSQITLNGFIRLKGQLQFYELSSFGALNASINRQFLKQKLIITLSANDIFASNKNNFIINQGSVNASGYRLADTRRIGINLRYNFGVRKKEETQNIFKVESPEKTN